MLAKITNKISMRTGTNDSLLGDVEFSRGVTGVTSLSNTVDFVVDRGTVVITILTSASNSLFGLLAVESNNWIDFRIPIARAQDARHRYKQPSLDPCASSSAAF